MACIVGSGRGRTKYYGLGWMEDMLKLYPPARLGGGGCGGIDERKFFPFLPILLLFILILLLIVGVRKYYFPSSVTKT